MTQPSSGAFTAIQLPREVAKVLVNPIPILDVDSRVLETIDPLRPVTSVDAWHEFQFAPMMTLLRTPPLFAGRANELFALVPATSDTVPPLELDHAFCSPGTDGGIRVPGPDGTFEMPKLGEIPVLGKFSLARLRYRLARLRIQRPPAGALPNSYSVGVTLRDIVTEVDNVAAGGPHVTYFAGMDELAIDCVATFRAPLPGPCGNVPVSCSAVTVDVVNLQHNLPVPVTEQFVQDEVAALLLGGVTLHFEGFATTGLIVDQAGRLGLSGAPNDGCSHVPAPPPPMAPVRGLVRSAATIGKGELIGSNGSVMPFELLPEVRVDWGFAAGTLPRPFRAWSVEKPPEYPLPYRLHGNELPRPIAALPSVIETSVELVQHIQKNCWLKPLGLLEFVGPLFPPGATRGRPIRGCENDECWCTTCEAGAKFFLELVSPDGTSYVTRDLRVLSGGNRVVVESASAAEFAEVAPRLTRLDGALCPGPNCPRDCGSSRCAPWVRLDLVEDALPPFPGGTGGPPWEVILWAGRSLETLEHQMGLTPKCPLTPGGPGTGETVVGQRIISPPSVVLGEMMVDSAAFPPVRMKRVNADFSEHFTGLVEKSEPPSSPYVLTEHNLESGPALRVELTEHCRAHVLGAPHLGAPCWSGTFELPAPGTISPSVAFSDTSVGRIPLRTVFDSGGPLALLMVATLGNRLAAVQGTLDRSGLQMFTKVPRIYQDIGLTTARYDFRGAQEEQMLSPVVPGLVPSGSAYFDWEHGPTTFPLPYTGDFRHPALSQRRWGGDQKHSSQYFADWRSDELLLRWTGDEPFSYCPSPNQLFVSPREFAFTGAGLGRKEVKLPATEVLESGTRGPAPSVEYRVSPSQPAAGRTFRVLP